MVRLTSGSRPISGSILPTSAFLLRLTQKASSAEFALLLGRLRALLFRRFLLGAAHRPRVRGAMTLGDAVRDEIDGIVARHVLFLQEERRMGLPLGENGHQHIGARDLFAARRLDVNDRALDDALEARRGFRPLLVARHQLGQFLVDVLLEVAPQQVEIDVARPHHRGGVAVVDERQQQMLERRQLMIALAGQRQGAVQGLFETAGECRHADSSPFPWCIVAGAGAGGQIP